MIINKLKKNQFFWNTLKVLGKAMPLWYFKRIPDNIIIEPTNACNLRCPVCPTHFAMKRDKGFMKFSLFKTIIDDFKNKSKKPNINMNFAGEPLLNKDLPKFIEYANRNGHKTFVSTNVTMLTKKLSEDIIKSGLHSIHLCIDGFSKKSQESYRVGSDFNKVKKNIEDFLKIKKELNSKIHVSIQTLITSLSEKEMDKIIEWAKNIGADEINFKSFSLGSFTSDKMRKKYSNFLPKNKKYLRKSSKVNKTICLSPINYPVIYWNGELGICCIDFDNFVKVGNIKKEGFIKLIKKNRTAQIRKLAFLKTFAICRRCSIGNADFYGLNIDLRK